MRPDPNTPDRVPGGLRRGAACLWAGVLGMSLLGSAGCNSINGLLDGFERDVDTFAARVDAWSDELLPTAGVGPQVYEPTHVDLPDRIPKPSRYAGHTRFGKPHQ